MSDLAAFSPDYATARDRFRAAVSRLGWQLEAQSIGVAGPSGEDLTIDVGWSSGGDPDRVLVLSSGVHGVEGFFGSAVQVALLQRWASAAPPSTRCVLLHGLNPFGFAWLR
ncbi:MAG: M14 family metallopeptidase, partial [Planctomycetes bacterium]|nr:M14 family metallopeptidase [Planctomycetota bacterium]